MREPLDVRRARDEVRARDRALREAGRAGPGSTVYEEALEARRRLIRTLLIYLLPPGREAMGVAVRLDRFLCAHSDEIRFALLDDLARRLTPKEDRA